MKKFKTYPTGLKLGHLEQETALVYHWNQCVDEKVLPSTPITIPEARVAKFKHINGETKTSVISRGLVEKVGDKWKLSNKAVKRIIQFLAE